MGEKRILIVDDEDAILSVLKNGLRKLGTDYQVVTASNGNDALEKLKHCQFDLIITDYRMAGMDGLELLEAARTLQPETRMILMTAYGNDSVEAEARRLQVCRYLTKPLKIDAFRQIVKETLSNVAISRPGIWVLSDERYMQIHQLLSQLQTEVGARCVLLADSEGRLIAHSGNADGFPLEQIVSLLGGSIAGLVEAGRMIDGDEKAIHLVYREGLEDNMYIVNVGQGLLLIVLIARGPYSSRLGAVWYSAQQTVISLRPQIGEAEYANPLLHQGQRPSPANAAEREPWVTQPAVLSFDEAIRSGLIADGAPQDQLKSPKEEIDDDIS